MAAVDLDRMRALNDAMAALLDARSADDPDAAAAARQDLTELLDG